MRAAQEPFEILGQIPFGPCARFNHHVVQNVGQPREGLPRNVRPVRRGFQIPGPRRAISKRCSRCRHSSSRTLLVIHGGLGCRIATWQLGNEGRPTRGGRAMSASRAGNRTISHGVTETRRCTRTRSALQPWIVRFIKQLLTCLRLTGLKLGYLLNFGEALMKEGITRVVHGER